MPSIPKPLTATGEVTDVAGVEEILKLLSAAARRGNVPAMRILLEEHRRGESQGAPEAPSVIDELGAKRKKAASGR